MAKWNLRRLYTDVLSSRIKLITWCKFHGLLPLTLTCPEGHVMTLHENVSNIRGKRLGQFRCRRPHTVIGKAQLSITWTRNTVFQNSNASPEKLLIITYCFTCHDLNQADACHESSIHISGTSNQTVCQWYCYCRELITNYVLKHREYNVKLGGQKVTVEVEKFRFGKRRFVGDLMEEMWALGMVETSSKHFRAVICPGNDDPEMLFQIIEKHIESKTTIVINDAEFYQRLSDNYTFMDPMPQECEQDEVPEISECSESTLPSPQTLKFVSGAHCDNSYGDYVLEYLWRREMKMGNDDAFENFIHIIRCEYPV